MNHLWQNMPSMAFKLGLYDGVSTIKEAKKHGDFGTGQFAALDGELIVHGGEFYRARFDGSVRLADDDDQLCFAQLCFYDAEKKLSISQKMDQPSFERVLGTQFPFGNLFCAFQIEGFFTEVVPTSPPRVEKPYPPFADAVKLRKPFPRSNILGSVVGFFSPAFTADSGIPGFHYHFISEDKTSGGHVISFVLSEGELSTAHIRGITLTLPSTTDYENVRLS
jgi:acetolactate decarboxylase